MRFSNLCLLTASLCISPTLKATPIYELFSVTTDTANSQSLSYGSGSLQSGSSNAYFSIDYANVISDTWKQVTTSNGDPIFDILWTFDSSQSISQIFSDAVSTGVNVTWTVTDYINSTEETIDGVWRWSSGDKFKTSDAFWSGTGEQFSYDDGIFGAASIVDGNDYKVTSYGTGNRDKKNDAEGNIWLNGVGNNAVYTSWRTEMFVATPAPEPSSFIILLLGFTALLGKSMGRKN